MNNTEMESKARELKELTRMREELEGEITILQDAIKAELTARTVDEITAGEYRIRWTAYTSTRVDTASLKRLMPDVAAQFTKTTEAKRFTVQ